MEIIRRSTAFVRKYFVPSEDNGYRPHILQEAAAGGILLLILSTFALVNIQSIALLTSNWLSSAVLPSVLVDLTNQNRIHESLGSLSRSALLDEAAKLKAEDMAKYSYFAHNSPKGITPWYWFKRVGYEYTFAGENLAVHFTDSDDVVKAWMNSPGHRANILNGHYSEIGIGTAKGEYKGTPTIFVVQLFGRAMTSSEKGRVLATENATVLSKADEPSLIPAEGSQMETLPTAPSQPAERSTSASSSRASIGVLYLENKSDDKTLSPEPTSTIDIQPAPPMPVPAATITAERVQELPEIATESPALAAGILNIPIGESGGNTAQVRQSGIFGQMAVRPHMIISIIYTLLAFLVLGALGTSIALEWRRHHPVQVAYGVGLLAAMWVAFYVQTVVLAGALIT